MISNLSVALSCAISLMHYFYHPQTNKTTLLLFASVILRLMSMIHHTHNALLSGSLKWRVFAQAKQVPL